MPLKNKYPIFQLNLTSVVAFNIFLSHVQVHYAETGLPTGIRSVLNFNCF